MNKQLVYHPLDQRVLVVASVNPLVGDWAAYVGPVEGLDHKAEAIGVSCTGTKCSKQMGEMLFPQLANLYQWRS